MDTGILHLPVTETAAASAPLWSELAFNRWAVVAATLLAILVLSEFIRVFPRLMDCLVRNRGSLELEHSVSFARSRNHCSLGLLPSLILVIDRYGVLLPSFAPGIERTFLRFAMAAALPLGWILLRLLMQTLFFAFASRRFDGESRATIRHIPFNFFCLGMAVLLPLLGVMVLAGASDASVRTMVTIWFVLSWAVSTYRTGLFLSGGCSRFATFLYLCSSEFVPAGMVAATALAL